MSVGFALTKADIDARAGSLVVAVRDALDRCRQMNVLLNDTNIIPPAGSDAFLQGLGYTASEITTLRAAFTDLNSLYNVSHATATVPSVNDFFFNAKKLAGVVLT